MPRRLLLSIKTQMIILIVVMSFVPFGIIIYTALNQRKYDLQAAVLLAETLSNEVSNEQKVLLSGAEQLLNSLSYIPCIRKRDAKAAAILFAELINKNPEITNILIADTAGRVWASALPVNGVVMANDRRYFKNVMASGKFSSGEYTIGRVINKPALSFGYPIKDHSGQVRDIAIISFTLTKYNKLLKMHKMPDSTSLVLTDHKGTILFDAIDSKFIGKRDAVGIFKQMTQGPDRGNFEAVGITGKKRYFAFQKLRLNSEQTPYMYVRTGILKETVSNKIRNDLMLNSGMMLAVTLLSFGFASYISRRGIVDKIIALRDATRKVAEGNMDVHVSDHVSGGELGELGQAFDEMARNLADDNVARKHVEEALRYSEEKCRNLLETAIEGIWMLDEETRTTFVNQRMTEMLGYAPEEMLGRTFNTFVIQDDTYLYTAQMNLRRLGRGSRYELRFNSKNGETIWTMVSGTPTLDAEGRFSGSFAMISDITDRKRSEKALREKDAAVAANLAKSRLLRTVAHEFRTPLGLLTTSTDILDRYWDRLTPEKRFEQNEHIRSAAHQISNLVNSVISFNQMETARQWSTSHLLDIAGTCQAIAAEVQAVWSAGHELNLDIAPDCGTALLDEILFRRTVENLLTNAFRYTPSGGIVSLHVRKKNCRLIVEIIDSGIGIPEEDLHLVFDAFYRCRNVEARRGLGLGLSIVHDALSDMGGTIAVTSRIGEGTTMRVEIPVADPAQN